MPSSSFAYNFNTATGHIFSNEMRGWSVGVSGDDLENPEDRISVPIDIDTAEKIRLLRVVPIDDPVLEKALGKKELTVREAELILSDLEPRLDTVRYNEIDESEVFIFEGKAYSSRNVVDILDSFGDKVSLPNTIFNKFVEHGNIKTCPFSGRQWLDSSNGDSGIFVWISNEKKVLAPQFSGGKFYNRDSLSGEYYINSLLRKSPLIPGWVRKSEYKKHYENFMSARRLETRRDFIGKYKGSKGVIPSVRLVGCEIEASRGYESSIADPRAAERIPAEVGITTDGSLKNGLEFIIPPSSKNKFEEFVVNTTKELRNNGWCTTDDCGLHIHIEAKDLKRSYRKLVQTMSFYYLFENVLFNLVPNRRRDGNYCRSLKRWYSSDQIRHILRHPEDADLFTYRPSAVTKDKGEKTYIRSSIIFEEMKARRPSPRYFFVNFHSVFYRNTLEIRSLQGTLDPKLIIEWAILHSLILEYTSSKRFNFDYLEKNELSLEFLSKTILLPESSYKFWKRQEQLWGPEIPPLVSKRLSENPENERYVNF